MKIENSFLDYRISFSETKKELFLKLKLYSWRIFLLPLLTFLSPLIFLNINECDHTLLTIRILCCLVVVQSAIIFLFGLFLFVSFIVVKKSEKSVILGNILCCGLYALTIAFSMLLYQGLENNSLERVEENGNIIISAIEKYRMEESAYPLSLELISPKYLKEIPASGICSQKKFLYRQHDSSFTLALHYGIIGWAILLYSKDFNSNDTIRWQRIVD